MITNANRKRMKLSFFGFGFVNNHLLKFRLNSPRGAILTKITPFYIR